MKRFQIRREPFGVAMVEAPDAREALLTFVAGQTKGKLRPEVSTRDDGSAEVDYDGARYRAVLAGES